MAEKKSLIGPSELLMTAWEKYKLRWKTYVGIQLVAIALLIAGVILLAIPPGIFFAVFEGNVTGSPLASGAVFIYFVFAAVSIMLLASWGQLALLTAFFHDDKNTKESFVYARRHSIWSYFELSLLTGLIVFGGMAVFVIPGILFALWMTFAKFEFVGEKKRGFAALLTSREFFRGRFWDVFGRILVIGLLSFMLQMSVSSIPFFGMILTIVFAPFSTLYMYFLYKDLQKLSHAGKKQEHNSGTMFRIAAVLGGILILLAVLLPLLKILSHKPGKLESLVPPNKAVTVYFSGNKDKEKRELLVTAYEDTNKNGIRDVDEMLLQQGEVEVRNSTGVICSGIVSEQYRCTLPETGEYYVSYTPNEGVTVSVPNPVVVTYPKHGPYNQGFQIQFGIFKEEL